MPGKRDGSTMAISDWIKHVSAIGTAVSTGAALIGWMAAHIEGSRMLILICGASLILSAVLAYWLARVRGRWVFLVLLAFVALSTVSVTEWARLADAPIRRISISITTPRDGSDAGMRQLVAGKVDDPRSRVYVLVHPLAVRQIWVQNPPVIGSDGKWQTYIGCGTESLGLREKYEVIAIASNENYLVTLATGNLLREGKVLERLPRNTNVSNIATVRRTE